MAAAGAGDGGADGPDGAAARPVPPVLRWAAAVVAVEAVALAVLGAGYAVSGLVGDPESRLGTVLAGVLAVLVGLALLPVARALGRARSWAVAPTVVVHLLAVVVAVGLLQGGVPAVGLPLLAAAAGVLSCLAAPTSRAALKG